MKLDSQDALFLWLIHHIAEEFGNHAVLKGGMVLRLLDCPRATNDLDYVFVPYSSKKDIAAGVKKVLARLPSDAEVHTTMHSKMLRATIRVGKLAAQLEASVAEKCSSMPIATEPLARVTNQLSRIIRVMSHDVALANKLAAWNERRLLRDLYDCHFFVAVLGAKPDEDVLAARLAKIQSQRPELRRRKKISRAEFLVELEAARIALEDKAVKRELSPVFPLDQLPGLADRMKVSLARLIDELGNLEERTEG